MKRSVSLDHDCTDTSTSEERDSSRRIERKLPNGKALHLVLHDVLCILYIVCNVFCFNFVLYCEWTPREYKIH